MDFTADISLRSIENVQLLSSRNMDSLRTNSSFQHFIDYSYICKGSSSHDKIITSSRTVSIKISFLYSSLFQKSSSSWWNWDISCRWNMISCNRISKNCQNIGIVYRLYFRENFFSWLEERRIMNISWFLIPIEMNWFFNLQCIPSFSSFAYFIISLFEDLRPDYCLFDVPNLWFLRPYLM